MKKQQEKHIISNINTFDEEASIYKLLFQDRAIALLKNVIDKISIDRYEHVNFKLPSILIVGKEGKQLISRAFSNSMCNTFEVVLGKHLGMGGYSGSVFKNIETETIYYISSAEKLNAYSVSLLHKLLTQGYFKFRNHMEDEDTTVSTDNKLFIFGVNEPKKLSPDLYKAIDYHCCLRNYNTLEMEILVEQRLRWCSIDFDKQVPAIIVHNGAGSISNCMRLLSVCFLIMRGNNEMRLTVKDIEIGIALNLPIEGLTPSPVDNDMPI